MVRAYSMSDISKADPDGHTGCLEYALRIWICEISRHCCSYNTVLKQ